MLPSIDYAIQTGATYLAIGFVLLIVFQLFYKNWMSAGIVTAYLIFLLLHWGTIHNLIKSISPVQFLGSYKFLIPFFLVILTLIILVLNKSKVASGSLGRLLNYIYILLISVELADTTFLTSDNESFKPKAKQNYENLSRSISQRIDSAPDIYWIIFDEYASSKSLKHDLGFDNSRTDSILKQRHFYTVFNSSSNYNLTTHAISSTLFMDYLTLDANRNSLRAKDFLRGRKNVNEAPVPKVFADAGYIVKNFGLFDLNGAAAPNKQLFEDIDKAIFENETFVTTAMREIGWNFSGKFADKLREPARTEKRSQLLIAYKNFQNLMNELRTESIRPRFVYAHFLMPHENYLVDRTGKERIPTPNENKSGVRDSLYLDQLMFCNRWIDSITSATGVSIKRKRVIVIQGDHGRRTMTNDETKPIISDDKSFKNLNAFYFSDHEYNFLYDSISSVNSFRVIIKKYFDHNMALLPDSIVHIYE